MTPASGSPSAGRDTVGRAAPHGEGTRHYLGLDGLRGVAAMGVVLFHCSTRLDLPYLFAHGYLAVDFFFVLSGFVLAHAYGERLRAGRMSLGRFVLIRAIRLLPLIVLGTLLAAVLEVGRPNIADQHRHAADVVTALALGSLLVPTLTSTTLENAVFPLNGPAWSLLLESVANVAFAIWARARQLHAALIPVLLFSAWGLFEGLARTGAIGFGAVPTDFWLGFARVGWSFTLGLVLYRCRHRASPRSFPVATAGFVAILLMPSLGALDALFDAACVLVVLPWIVFAASRAPLSEAGRHWSAWSGELSYPIYALHYPVIRLSGVVGTRLHLSPPGRLALALASLAAIVVLAGVAYRRCDVPVRRWLSSALRS